MICINCFYIDTAVINSRPHKKRASIWRRRKCSQCNTVFTTNEKPTLKDGKKVYRSDSTSPEPFSLSKLTLSIAAAFTHDPIKAAYDALWLAETVEETVITQYSTVSTDDIAATVHQTLKKFDELAAIQYAAKHQLIQQVRRRGRPSLSPVERGPQTDASPSQ